MIFSMTSMTIGYDMVVLVVLNYFTVVFSAFIFWILDSICFYLHLFIEN